VATYCLGAKNYRLAALAAATILLKRGSPCKSLIDYYRHGGILPFVQRQLLAKA
jgi:hypothetical protein